MAHIPVTDLLFLYYGAEEMLKRSEQMFLSWNQSLLPGLYVTLDSKSILTSFHHLNVQ